MAVLFSKVVSLFKTTLSASMSAAQTTMTLAAVPGGNIQYPNWIVIDPNGNAEIVYCPTAPASLTYSGVVRGVSSSLDTDGAGTGVAHPANVDVVIAPLHRQWNSLVEVMTGVSGSGSNAFRIGDGLASDKYLYAQNAAGNKPFFRYDNATSKWLFSNDGLSTYDPQAGGSGLAQGLGISIGAGLINLDLRATGGLRSNQGTGSKQADVDPAIVARLDTANTWTAVQTATAARIQITTDASAANDAVRKSYMDAQIAAAIVNSRGVKYCTEWLSARSRTILNNSAAINYSATLGVQVLTDTGAGDQAIAGSIIPTNVPFKFNPKIRGHFACQTLAAVNGEQGFVGCGAGVGNGGGDLVWTGATGVFLYLTRTAGTWNLVGRNANSGSFSDTSVITTLATSDVIEFDIEIVDDVSVTYYVSKNGAAFLSAVLSTNVPAASTTTSGMDLQIGVGNGAAGNSAMDLRSYGMFYEKSI